jgi:hypothetical protein
MRVLLRRLLAPVALVLLLGACQATATVTVRMHDDGSGVVEVRVVLDAAAVRAAEVGGAKLAERVRLSDLAGAGWTVSPWRRTKPGGAVLTVSKPFTRPEQVAGIVRELNGAHGPLRGFRAARDASAFSRSWTVDGTVDLRKVDLGVADDQQLVANLTGRRLDVAGIEQHVATAAVDGLRIRARAELPGATETVAAVPGRRAVLAASAAATDVGRIALVVVGVLLGALAIALLVLGETRARRRRSRPRRIPTRSGEEQPWTPST